MDDGEMGAAEAETQLTALIAAARGTPTEAATYCITCSTVIPQARQEATGGTDMCIGCKEFDDA